MLRLATALSLLAYSPASAQVETGAAIIGAGASAAKNISDQGGLLGNAIILGLVLALGGLMYMLWWVRSLIKENSALRDKRSNDADSRAERFAVVAEGAKRTAEDATAAVKGVDREISELRDVVKLQTVGTDQLLKGQEVIGARIEKAAEKNERTVQDALRGRPS